jgi:hypothetical protein
MMGPTLLKTNKPNKTHSKNKDAPRKTHNA